ncbi:MAG: hypothetical protein HOP31_06285 [Ignavibacteria bacterium]|nr:hypothetical protein [Ignavibacteria bacterium]
MFIFKNIILFRVIILLVLAAFTGCVTSKIEYTETNVLPEDKTYRISEVFMKDGTVKVLKDKEPAFKLKYKGHENVLLYYENVNIEKIILLSDVSSLKIEVLESNTVLSIFIIAGAVALFVLLIYLVANSLGKFKAV